VELDSLTEEDFVRILTEPENALLKQYRALLSAEDVDLSFSDEAVREIARDAERVTRALENIGARRLHTILERVLSEVSFAGPDAAGARIVIDRPAVTRALADLVASRDLSRFVL
jgi:ATP-dependent HslUV protease ATP-binding subunit HslU